MTNHTGKQNTGAAQGGFTRKEWYSSCEKAFDKHFKNELDIKESFEYKNCHEEWHSNRNAGTDKHSYSAGTAEGATDTTATGTEGNTSGQDRKKGK